MIVLAFALTASAMTIAACGGGSSSSSSSQTTAGTSSSGGSEAAEVTAAEKFLGEEASGKPWTNLPDQPVKVPRNKNIWLISCGQAAAGCARVTKAGEEALKPLVENYGWKLTVYDTKLDPSRQAAGISQAIVAGADAIIPSGTDCSRVKPQLEEAKEKGILVISQQALDCNDPSQGETEPLFSYNPSLGPEKTLAETAAKWGEIQAAWVTANTDGKANILSFENNEFAITNYTIEGFNDYIEQNCSECKVEAVPFTLADLTGPPLQQKASSALIKYPDTNVVVTPYDAAAPPVAAAIVAAQKQGEILHISVEGLPADQSLIAEEAGQSADVGVDGRWLTYEAVDAAVRLLAGQEPVPGGSAPGIVDSSNAKPETYYEAPVDYSANYEKDWGVR